MPELDDDQFRAGLRRAVTITEVDDAWPTIARRVRRQRAGRAAARVGIPALCAVVLLGGAFALSRRGDGSRGVGTEPPNTFGNVVVTLAPSTTSSATTAGSGATSVDASVVTTPGPVPTGPVTTAPAAPSVPMDVPSPAGVTSSAATEATARTTATGAPGGAPRASSSWPPLGSSTVLGVGADVRAAAVSGAVCVAVTPASGADGGPDACGAGDWSAVVDAGDALSVVGVRTTPAAVIVTTNRGDVTVSTVPFEGSFVFGAALPVGVEVFSIDGSESSADCPYQDLYAAVGVKDLVAPGAGTGMFVQRCRGGAAYVAELSGHEVLQGGGALFERVGPAFEAVGLGGDLCDRSVSGLSDRESSVCAKVGL